MEKRDESKIKSSETMTGTDDFYDYCSDDPSSHDHSECADFHCLCC